MVLAERAETSNVPTLFSVDSNLYCSMTYQATKKETVERSADGRHFPAVSGESSRS